MPSSRRRRSLIWAGACALALTTSGCIESDPKTASTPLATALLPPVAEDDRLIDTVAQQRLANALVAELSCEDRDDYKDDLTFWDEMRGYDCVDAANTVSVRAYGSRRSVGQILTSWEDGLVNGRSARRGANWFVVGPRDAIARIDPPRGAPEVSSSSEAAPPPTAQEEFLTNCAQYSFDEAVRAIRGERVAPTDAEYYERAFPGVDDAVRMSIGQSDLAHLRAVDDEERWQSLLSPRGPAWKQACREAMSQKNDPGSAGGDS